MQLNQIEEPMEKRKKEYEAPQVYSFSALIELGFAGSQTPTPLTILDGNNNERVEESTTYFF